MGSWGSGLYQDDAAADVRDTISTLAKLPVSGDRLLEILLKNWHEGVELDDDGGPTFWLAAADQFERRGIACPRAFERALTAIDTGADLRDQESRGAHARDLKQRAKMLSVLAQRLRSPRPVRPRPTAKKPPPFVVEVGELYSFPTMNGEGFNPWFRDWEQARFKPDGWGALLVVARGRVFDWMPWCAISSLSVPALRKPTLDDALRARLYSATQGATLCVPRRSHLRKMDMQLLGRVELDAKKAASVISDEHTPETAVTCGWSFVPQARAWVDTYKGGVAVSTLLA